MVLRPSRRKTRLGESGAKPRISKLGLAGNNLLRLHRLADPRIVITTSACLADKAAVAGSTPKPSVFAERARQAVLRAARVLLERWCTSSSADRPEVPRSLAGRLRTGRSALLGRQVKAKAALIVKVELGTRTIRLRASPPSRTRSRVSTISGSG